MLAQAELRAADPAGPGLPTQGETLADWQPGSGGHVLGLTVRDRGRGPAALAQAPLSRCVANPPGPANWTSSVKSATKGHPAIQARIVLAHSTHPFLDEPLRPTPPRRMTKSGHCHRFYCYLAATFAAVSFQPVRRHRYSWYTAPPSDD
jgi:hypothetical protein